jgi:excisionase family DNA binding protein
MTNQQINGRRIAKHAEPIESRLSYTLWEAARLVGVSYPTLWRAVQAKELHPIRGLTNIRISKAELNRFLGDVKE